MIKHLSNFPMNFRFKLLLLSVLAVLLLPVHSLAQGLLFNNGPLVTHAGAGTGGADVSQLQSVTLGYGTFGFTSNNATSFRLTDNFTNTVPWKIDYIDVYAYQTGSSTTSTFTGGVIKIWDGDPSSGTANTEFGDFSTNRMILTDWTNIYRTNEPDLAATNRPIMRIRLN